MSLKNVLVAVSAGMLALPAFAQTPQQPGAPSASAVDSTASAADGGSASNAAAPAAATSGGPVANPFPVQSAFRYDDPNPRNRAAGAPACDDATYGQAQVHGSIDAGAVAGNRVSGTYEGAVVNVTKALGSCDDPAGEVSASISVHKDDFNRTRHRRH